MKLSDRLKRISEFVSDGNILADIGTDHGYIPIYLVNEGRINKAFAMDIGVGPLERAKEHILLHNLCDKIETRLSDGLDELKPHEADTILIAGMGGQLMIDIMSKGEKVLKTSKELVISPHSEIDKVRRYLVSKGFFIVDEDMIIDSGKYYVIMKWNLHSGDGEREKDYTEEEYLYGRILLKNKNEILKEYLLKEYKKLKTIVNGLLSATGEEVKNRKKDILLELSVIEGVLRNYYKMEV